LDERYRRNISMSNQLLRLDGDTLSVNINWLNRPVSEEEVSEETIRLLKKFSGKGLVYLSGTCPVKLGQRVAVWAVKQGISLATYSARNDCFEVIVAGTGHGVYEGQFLGAQMSSKGYMTPL
jgi:hypothetical protein